MFDSFVRHLSLEEFLINVFWTVLITALAKFVLWARGSKIVRQKWHWLAVALISLTIVTFIRVELEPTPKLSADIDATWIGDAAVVGSKADAMLMLRVRNQGSFPTAIDNWEIQAKLANGAIFRGRSFAIPPGGISINTPELRNFYPSDDIRGKAGAAPIQPGAIVWGLVIFLFDDVNLNSLLDSQTEYTVTFKDVLKNRYEAKVVPFAHPSPHAVLWFPGVTPPGSTEQKK